jgi:hypothetical protein
MTTTFSTVYSVACLDSVFKALCWEKLLSAARINPRDFLEAHSLNHFSSSPPPPPNTPAKIIIGLNSDESIACCLNVASAWSSRSRCQRWPTSYYILSLWAWPSASCTDCLHISKSRRNHHREHFTEITSHLAFMSTSIADCKCFISFILLHLLLLSIHSRAECTMQRAVVGFFYADNRAFESD